MLGRLTVGHLIGPGALLSAGLGLIGAEQVATSGPDLQGIALIITSVSGLIATVGALVIGLRKKPDDPDTKAIIEALERLGEDQRKKDEP